MVLYRRLAAYVVVLLLLFNGCKNPQYLARVKRSQMITIDQQVPEDTAITNYIRPFKRKLEIQMNEILGNAPRAMLRNRNLPETQLSNFFVDALLDIGRKIDSDVNFSLATKDGIRSSIPEGPVTVQTIFELMPFENFITILELRGSDVLELADFIAQSDGQPVGGAQVEIRNHQPVRFRIGGQEVNEEATYKLVTYDFIANGGDLVNGLDQPVNRMNTDKRVRDSLIEYIKQLTQAGGLVESSLDGRVKILQ